MKINVCSGSRVLAGYVNVDISVPTDGPSPEVIADARVLPFPDACAEELMCIHGFEHFYEWEVDPLLDEWRRVLVPGGELVLELPNLLKCCQNVLSGWDGEGAKHVGQMSMWGLYGDPRPRDPFMCHRWAWTPLTLRQRLQANGFVKVREETTRWHSAGRVQRDMRVVARKG